VASGDSVSSTKRTVLSFLRGGSPNLNANRTSSCSKTEFDSVQFSTATEESGLEDKHRSSSVSNSVMHLIKYHQPILYFKNNSHRNRRSMCSLATTRPISTAEPIWPTNFSVYGNSSVPMVRTVSSGRWPVASSGRPGVESLAPLSARLKVITIF